MPSSSVRMVSQSGMGVSPPFGRVGSPRLHQVGPKLLCGRLGQNLEEDERPGVWVVWERGAAGCRFLGRGVRVPDVMGGNAAAGRHAFGGGFDETSVGV